jgi:hypothetical protein
VRSGHRRTAGLGLASAALSVGLATAFAVPALAAGPTSSGTTTANVDVNAAIALTALTPSFTLTGVPGDTPVDNGAVTMNVLTNNGTGYNVTVQAANANLTATGGSTIPVTDLEVNDSFAGGTAGWLPLSSTTAVQVFSQATPSGNSGDTVTNDYRMTIPNVPNGAYSDTLDYVASTNP